MSALQAVQKARELLLAATPREGDCGLLCQHACCQADSQGKGGMLLFPLEEKLYQPLPQGWRIQSDASVVDDGKLLVCAGECRREQRPLGCRFFPLAATIGGTARQGRLILRIDRRAHPVCPLAGAGLPGLVPGFIRAAREAACLLAQWAIHRRFLRRMQAHLLLYDRILER